MSERTEKKSARAVLTVRGASCVTCALAIERQVKRVEGVEDVKSSIMLNEVFVDFDPSKTDVSRITEAIRKTGYSNSLVRKS